MGSRMSKCWKIIQENKMLFLQDACIETATKQRMSAKRLSFYEINLFVFFFTDFSMSSHQSVLPRETRTVQVILSLVTAVC